MKVGESFNGFGTRISLHRCLYCGSNFTVTPATDNGFGLGCLASSCSSYDIMRDVDLMFDEPLIWQALHGPMQLQGSPGRGNDV